MEHKKQSSIEWLKQRVLYIVPSSQKDDLIKLFEQAKAMHKEEIIEAWIATDNELQRIVAEQYYKDTFNK
jgi:hypoxanthine phosphoribosyltransferase